MKANPNNYQEAMDILQEECAEVIVEVSKCRRFGLNSVHYKTGVEHNKMLEQEVGDVLAMVDILIEQEVLDPVGLATAKLAKKEKLTQWSNIYEQN
jgi:NTP pyrophosphatase (non-canonical NTP hydrolase)